MPQLELNKYPLLSLTVTMQGFNIAAGDQGHGKGKPFKSLAVRYLHQGLVIPVF